MQELFSKTIKILFILLFIGTISQPIKAQIGITGTYASMDAPNWQQSMFDSRRFDPSIDFGWDSSYKIGIDYAIKILPETRLYIQPGIFYSSFNKEVTINDIGLLENLVNFQSDLFEFNLNTNIYLLDLEGDCDCPTWSKDGNVIKKGFFLQVSPGLTYSKTSISEIETIDSPTTFSNSDVSPNLGLGFGLDIGISDFITITPLVKFKRHFNVEWELLNFNLSNDVLSSTAESVPNDSTPINQLELGLRMEFRWKR